MSTLRQRLTTALPLVLLVVLGSIHTFVLEPKTADAAVPKNDRKILSGSYYGEGAYYSQPYYQPYYQASYYSQPYYQPYYQSYYQGTYQTTFTDNVRAGVNLSVTGSISKGSGSFVIDHPLDPKNKLLYHSFVESPDVKNIYDGIATVGAAGDVRVQLPSYFMALNKDVRYLLTPIGTARTGLFIKSPVENNAFSIGGVPGTRVSWQVTGIRKDKYILDNPIIVEVEKSTTTPVNKGEYIFDSTKDSYFNQVVSYLRNIVTGK